MVQPFAETVTNARCDIMVFCRNTSNGKPTDNTLFYMEDSRMSILTKTSRRRTCFEGDSYLQKKTSMSNQLQSHCCKQVPSSDKRVRCTECPMKGIITNTLSYKETGRLLANITITAYPYKSISANVEVSLPFHTKGFLLAERKRCLASIVLTKHPFRQS